MKTFKLSFFLLVLMLIPTVLGFKVVAQNDSIPRLIITEVRLTNTERTYIEITNVGDTALDLSHFEIGTLDPGSDAFRHNFAEGLAYQTRLPNTVLQPSQSYLIASVNDEYPTLFDPRDRLNLIENGVALNRFTPVDWLEKLDLPIHRKEFSGPNDSISTYAWMLRNFNGQSGNYIEYHMPNGDSVVIDVVKADIQDNNRVTRAPNDVAGVFEGTKDHVLVRKTRVTIGNLDWEQSRGIGSEDSDWLVIPFRRDHENPLQKYFTTLKHHGNAVINPSTFRSQTIAIDFENNIIEVPWGIYRDSIMFEFDLGLGLAWGYIQSPLMEDSVFLTARTGDTLTMMAVGDELVKRPFRIIGNEPTEDMNIVVPKFRRLITTNVNTGEEQISYQRTFRVTEKVPLMDSVLDLTFGLRVDTLFKYLEKPANASWEIIWIDGNERPDLKRGDILKVTSQSGLTKEYYLAVESVPKAGENALLEDIQWPDVPEFTFLSPEWNSSYTIPGFNPTINTYKMKVPFGFDNIPGLVPLPADPGAQVSVERATNLKGTVSERTTTFTITAEDGSTLTYSVFFERELPSFLIQPLVAEPLVTQLTFRQFAQNNFIEITNPGNQSMDLSNYLIAAPKGGSVNSPADVITHLSGNYGDRYQRYVPGYDFVSEGEWLSKIGFLTQDPEIDPFLAPSETFVIGMMRARQTLRGRYAGFCDLIFDAATIDLTTIENNTAKMIPYGPLTSSMFDRNGGNFTDPVTIFEILNDSIFEGTKGITDPNDFKLVEIIGDFTNTAWNVNGINEPFNTNHNITRKSKYWKADTVFNYSFGNTPDSSQWVHLSMDMIANEFNLNNNQANDLLPDGLGFHQFDLITDYVSTIASLSYIVSDGYTSPQTIIGIDLNTTVENFISKLILADSAQSLTVFNGENVLANDATISDNDKLVVVSADGNNTTEYTITVSEGGLDNNAILTSETYSVETSGSVGTISGIPFGATLQSVKENVVVPATATLNILENGVVVPVNMINYDTVKVETKASHLITFEVVAQNNTTIITYSLVTDAGESDAKLFSDMYTVNELNKYVSGIPANTLVKTLFNNLKANKGATVKLFDKAGNERTLGTVAFDDKVEVTSEDGSTVVTYYLEFQVESAGSAAFLMSDEYVINQVDLLILNIGEGVSVSDFTSKLTPAEGATMVVVDADGNATSTGTVSEGFKVIVTSGNGQRTLAYTIAVNTAMDNINASSISIYPNPTRDVLFISGLQAGSVITVYNVSGEAVRKVAAEQLLSGSLSLENEPAGIYFISVKKNNFIMGTLKVVKQ